MIQYVTEKKRELYTMEKYIDKFIEYLKVQKNYSELTRINYVFLLHLNYTYYNEKH